MEIDLEAFKKIEITDIPSIRYFIRSNKCMRSAFSPVNLLIWGTQFDAEYAFVSETLIIYNKAWNCILLPQSHNLPPGAVKEISDRFYQAGKCGRVSFLDKAYIEKHKKEFEDYNIFIDRDNADYIYFSERLAALRGKKLQKKKNQVSQFVRANPDFQVSDVQPEDAEECFELSEKWITEHHRKHQGYKYEKKALHKAFSYYDKLQLKGKKVMINGRIVAFSLYSELNPDTVIVHFEKFARDYKGSAQMINREVAKEVCSDFQYINREEDMGIEQLRKAKKSYQPLSILESYIIEKKEKQTKNSNELTA